MGAGRTPQMTCAPPAYTAAMGNRVSAFFQGMFDEQAPKRGSLRLHGRWQVGPTISKQRLAAVWTLQGGRSGAQAVMQACEKETRGGRTHADRRKG